jgi:3-hydroxyisobutyrate dehydrogenase-like beta-hydroxyacid dehydrogenase
VEPEQCYSTGELKRMKGTVMSESRERVTVAGLGLMGAAIARGLLRAGHQVTVWNRTYGKTEGLAEHGAAAVRDLAEAIVASTIVLLCVLDYPVMVRLLDTPEIRKAVRGRTIIPMATGSPDDVDLVANLLQPLGASVLDAKIMFFPAQVGDDDAELLLAGDEKAFRAYSGLLQDVGGICRYLSADVAAASVLYTAVWTYDFAARFAYMEAAALVEKSGLDLHDFEKSAALRTAQFPEQNQELSERFRNNDFEGDQATLDIYAEGMRPMLSTFRKQGMPAFLLEGVGKYTEAAKKEGRGRQDVSVVFDMIRSNARAH